MHPLQNGSQVIERPANKPVSGSPGYFTESGENNIPSYPGADWFNHVIDEFQNAISSKGLTFDSSDDFNLARLIESVDNSNQFSTTADLKAKAGSLPLGSVVFTYGFHSPFDDGGASYDITTAGIPDGLTVFDLGDGKHAKLRVGKLGLSLEQVGALGDSDGIPGNGNDDTKSIQAALNLTNKVFGKRGKRYRITHTVFYNSGLEFDGNFARFFFDGVADGSAFLPSTYDKANDVDYVEHVTFKRMIPSTKLDLGNFLGTPKARYVWFKQIFSEFVYWHVVDNSGGKRVYIEDCFSFGTRSAAYQMDVLADSTAIWGVAEDGSRLNCAFSSGGEDWTNPSGMYIRSTTMNGDGVTSTQVGVNAHRAGCRKLRVSKDCEFNALSIGVSLDEGEMSNITVRDSYFLNCNRSISGVADVDTIKILDNEFENSSNPYYTIYLVPSLKTSPRNKAVIKGNQFLRSRRNVRVEDYDNVDVSGNMFDKANGTMGTGTVTPASADDYCISIFNSNQYTVNGNNFENCSVSALIKLVNEALLISGAVTGNTSRNSAQFLTGGYQENLAISGNSIDGAASGASTAIYLENGRGNSVHANTIKQELSYSDTIVMHNEDNFSINGGSLYLNSSLGNGILITGDSTGKITGPNITKGLTAGSARYVKIQDTASVDLFAPYPVDRLENAGAGTLTYSAITMSTL